MRNLRLFYKPQKNVNKWNWEIFYHKEKHFFKHHKLHSVQRSEFTHAKIIYFICDGFLSSCQYDSQDDLKQ